MVLLKRKESNMTQKETDGFDSVTQYYSHVCMNWKMLLWQELQPYALPGALVIILLVVGGISKLFV